MNDAALLARCRDLHAAIAPGIWTRVHDADGAFVEAQGEMGDLIAVARFTPYVSEAEIEFVVEAPRMVGFLLGLVDRAIRAARKDPPPFTGEGDHAQHGGGGAPPSSGFAVPRERGEIGERRAKDYAAQAAMIGTTPAFKRFLMERHGLDSPATDERCAQKLRGLLGVTSRRELNDGGQAAERWQALWREFEGWRKAG